REPPFSAPSQLACAAATTRSTAGVHKDMAHKVFRRTVSTGVALASAGALALTPVSVTPEASAVAEKPRAVSVDVMPAGLVQDLQLIGAGATAAVEQSVDALVRKVPDLWWTVEEQWPDADLTHWNY